MQHFGVIGGGAWGTALALALVRAGRDVTLWAREAEVVASINDKHQNSVFLPGVDLGNAIKATGALADLKACDAWLLVTPVQHTRAVCADIAAIGANPATPIVLCSKGIEKESLKLPSMIVTESLGHHPVAVLSGPSFAIEVANDLPTAVTLACDDSALAAVLAQAIGSRTFRPYTSDDVLGVQLGGAIKNVIALATGIATGCGLGENARAALITRGLAEMMRLGLSVGGQAETLMGLSGLGDLMLTCSSTTSRNMSLGLALGQGRKLEDIMASRKSVAEGVPTTQAAVQLARQNGVDMPIVMAVDAVLNHGASVADTITALLSRPFKAERNR